MDDLDRRSFIAAAGALGAVPWAASAHAGPDRRADSPIPIPDEGWKLWIDREAAYLDDAIYLPSQVDLARLPINPPSGGWGKLDGTDALTVTLPTTVEQHLWGMFGERPYTDDEYRYANDDPVPRNGAYRGVSWWYRPLNIPAAAKGKRVILRLRGARMRAEIYLNHRLVGYSIMPELPISCDLSAAMRPGGVNELAIRITNPGGRYDWRDSTTITWGGAKLFLSHGFGGLDRGMTLSIQPYDAWIADAWVLNTPDPHRITGFMEVALDKPIASASADRAKATLLDSEGRAVAATIKVESAEQQNDRLLVRFSVAAPDAALWTLERPVLHSLRVFWGDDNREVRFGFRWFSPDGIGSDALLRLNGKRIKLYSAISWGYWGINGLWPTPTLARREVESAHALGLNCLHFHRNVGKAEVLDAQDELGLLRVMEPGGGRFAIARTRKPGEELSAAERFSRDFLVEKCVAMAKAFRSHPSLVQYSLQNELSADLANPDVQAVLKAIHDADPSRTVVLNDGFVARGSAQAMYLPYDDHFFRSDREQWGGWWNNHQGAGDQWYDKFYTSKDDYIHRQTGKPFIVQFGEMEGCAVADNHPAMLREIARAPGGRSYDAEDHRVIVANTEAFLDKWGFRTAFPTAEALFLSIGRKAYDAWQNYLENIRIGDAVDIASISGWETTAIENHSGIVDNLRGFKADPALLRASLLPVRAIAKQRRLAYVSGESAELDLWLFNDTAKPTGGTLTLSVVAPDGRETRVGNYPLPAQSPDVFSYLVAEQVSTPPLTGEGMFRLRVELSDHPEATFERQIWITSAPRASKRTLRIGLAGIAKSLRDQLAAIPGVRFEDFASGQRYDGIIASGLKADEIARRQIGEQTGLEAQPKKGETPKLVPGELSPEVLAAVRNGIPLLAMVPEDGLAQGVATQLAGLGLFSFTGAVGNLRAPWMGNWNYLREHPLFAGIPNNMAAGILHQIEGQPSNGLLVDGAGVEVIAAYSRDHDRHNGASCFIARQGSMRVLVHRMPDMVKPLQLRFLANAIDWLSAPAK